MLQTQDYGTKTNFIERKNISAGDNWCIGLDIGYSGVKGMSPNSVYCFPAFGRRFAGQMLNVGEPSPTDIQYKNENGEIWNVGESAQNMVTTDDSNDSIRSLYGRNRYFTPLFLVLARVGLGVGMMKNEYGNPNGKTLVVQTGLPPLYIKADAPSLRDVLAGHHEFEIRVGSKPWQKFNFDLPEENIRIIQQPIGSLLSAGLTNEAKYTPEASRYFGSNVMVFDAGFGTLDMVPVKNRNVEVPETFPELGMKAVLMEASNRIFAKYHTEVPVHAMQKCLKDGYVKVFDRKAMKTTNEPFGDILEEATKKVCMDAIDRMKLMFNSLLDFDYLLVTGGTGAAWQDIITEHFAGMESLKVITANQNDSLSHIYSNVRGYYLYRVGELAARIAKSEKTKS